MEILPVLFIPQSEALPIESAVFQPSLQEAALGALLHHVVEAIGRAIRQSRDKGILLGQHGENLSRIRIACDHTAPFRR